MTQMTKPKDHTGCIIVAVVGSCCFAAALGVAVEVLKFVALVKWIFG